MHTSRRVAGFLLFGLVATVCLAEGDGERQRYANRPDDLVPYAKTEIYKDVPGEKVQFKGAGREVPDPHVDSVKIGLIAPLTYEDHPIVPAGFRPAVGAGPKAVFGRHMLRGAEMALDDANREGGYHGIPFELVRRTDLVQWGQTSDELVKFAYEDKVWAVISGIDSNNNHVLNRATLKAEVPLVNAGSTDPTLTEHSIPWLVRCINDDRLNSYELLNYIHRVRHFTRIAVLRVNDRDGRVGVEEFIKGARRLGTPILLELRFSNGDTDFREQLEQLRQLDPEVIALWANPPEGIRILRQAREMGLQQQFVGFNRLTNPEFVRDAGKAGEGMILAATFNPHSQDPRWVDFQSRYRDRFHEAPDTYAAHAYDAARFIVSAIRQAGLNRPRIRDAMYATTEFPGVTGRIVFDVTMNDISRPWLVRIRDGSLEYFRLPDWPRVEHLTVKVPSGGSSR
ncbi:MAG: ABC transporter substrate-binding protein [Acidobacteriota bacterium]